MEDNETKPTQFNFKAVYLNGNLYAPLSKKQWKIEELSDGDTMLISPI
jgi:hypothetical protein